jgi:hypothetical protein
MKADGIRIRRRGGGVWFDEINYRNFKLGLD